MRPRDRAAATTATIALTLLPTPDARRPTPDARLPWRPSRPAEGTPLGITTAPVGACRRLAVSSRIVAREQRYSDPRARCWCSSNSTTARPTSWVPAIPLQSSGAGSGRLAAASGRREYPFESGRASSPPVRSPRPAGGRGPRIPGGLGASRTTWAWDAALPTIGAAGGNQSLRRPRTNLTQMDTPSGRGCRVNPAGSAFVVCR